MLIAQHLVHNEAARRKVAVDDELRRLAQHDLGHFAVDPAAQVAPAGLTLRVIAGVDDVIALVNFCQQLADLVRRGLAVVVEADNDVSAALVKARHQRRMLAEVFRQIDAHDMAVRRHKAADRAEGIIRRAVVHQNDLVVILRQGLHGGGDLRHHTPHRMLGAIARNHVRYFLHSCVLPSALTGAYRSPDPQWRRPAASSRPAGGRQRGCRARGHGH